MVAKKEAPKASGKSVAKKSAPEKAETKKPETKKAEPKKSDPKNPAKALETKKPDPKKPTRQPQPQPLLFATVTVSTKVLEETPGRTIKLIVGSNRSRAVRRALARRGFDAAARREGIDLLADVSGLAGNGRDGDDADVEEGVRDATTEADASDDWLVRLVRATLTHRHPRVAQRVLEGVQATTGPGSLLVLQTVLDRLDAVEKEADEDGLAAIARLAARGVDAAERERLRELVHIAQGGELAPVDVRADEDEQASDEEIEEEHLRALRALRAWYEEWSEVARLTIKRRDHLLLLGLAERRSAGSAARGESPDDGGEDAKGAPGPEGEEESKGEEAVGGENAKASPEKEKNPVKKAK